MTQMKKLLLALGVGLAAFTASADSSKPFDVGVTNTLALSATQTANMGSVIDLRNWAGFALRLRATGATTNSGNVVVTFARSTDTDPTASTAVWETTPQFTWTVALNSTNAVIGITNLPNDSFSGISGLKVVSIQNTAAGAVGSVKLEVTGKTAQRR